MTFRELGLCAPILKALEEQGYETPSPIQQYAIPHALRGKDILGCAQTGTGKTCAFAAPILQRLNRQKMEKHPIRALILTPTRELAIQIGESFQAYGAHMKLRSTVIFGGVGQGPQVEQLKRGADILVATPGRLGDLYQQKLIDLSHLEIFVLDEADRMLDMGFIHDVRKILQWLPEKKQTLFFSATMPPEITDLVNSLLHDPVRVAVDPVSSPVEAIDQSLYFVDKGNKIRLLAHLIEKLNVKNALVFTRTKHGANRVARDLEQVGIAAAAIHGNKSQTARQQALADFRAGKVRCLVATDIAARGLDIDELSYVFNYNLTEVPETYIHRIGRTGRAGREGVAISLCDFSEKELLKGIEKLIGRKLTVVEDHPYPMQVFEVPKRDKQGRIIHGEGTRSDAAAKEHGNKCKTQGQTAQQGVNTVETPQSEPELVKSKKPHKKRQSGHTQPMAKTLEIPVPHEYSTQIKTERPRLTRYGSLLDTGDSLPNTEFYRPNPLDSDVIMDATARLLASRRSTAVPNNNTRSLQKTRKERSRRQEVFVKQEASTSKKTKDTAKPGNKSGKKKASDSTEVSVHNKTAKLSNKSAVQHPKWEEKQRKQKKQMPQEEKKSSQAAPEKKGKSRSKTASRNSQRSTSKFQVKDSTEQPSLMKPFYLDFGR